MSMGMHKGLLQDKRHQPSESVVQASRKDQMLASMPGRNSDNRDEIDIRPSPPHRQNRSRSPLRSNPPEVFAKSPRHNRHIENEEAEVQKVSARKSPRNISEDRP